MTKNCYTYDAVKKSSARANACSRRYKSNATVILPNIFWRVSTIYIQVNEVNSGFENILREKSITN